MLEDAHAATGLEGHGGQEKATSFAKPQTLQFEPFAATMLTFYSGCCADYVRLLKYGDSLYRCKQLKRAALVSIRVAHHQHAFVTSY